jgi:hypothetical protein
LRIANRKSKLRSANQGSAVDLPLADIKSCLSLITRHETDQYEGGGFYKADFKLNRVIP